VHDTSPDYFTDQEIITEEMLTELDALNDEDEQSEKFENMELLGVCLPSSIIKFMTTDSSTVIILIMHSPAPSFSYAL